MSKKFIFLVCLLFLVNDVCGFRNTSVETFVKSITENPASISNFDVKLLIDECHEEDLFVLNNAILYIPTHSIRRSDIKKYYMPLCLNLITKWYNSSEMLQVISDGKNIRYEYYNSLNLTVSGAEINSQLDEYKAILATIEMLPKEKLLATAHYGNIRYLERMLFDKSDFIERIDPLPKSLQNQLKILSEYQTDDLFNDFTNTVIKHSSDINFLTENGELIFKFVTYTSNYIGGKLSGFVFNCFLSQNKRQEIIDIYLSIMRKRWGEEFFDNLHPIFTYEIDELFESLDSNSFFAYKDSLLMEGKPFAKFLPHKCPVDLTKDPGFDIYNDKFYELLSFIFEILKTIDTNKHHYTWDFFKNIGCNNQTDFIDLYTRETLNRYYAENHLINLGRVEELSSFIQNMYGKISFNTIYGLAAVYLDLNPRKAHDLLRNTSLIDWVELQYKNGTEITHDLLYAISFTANVYASLYNKFRYPKIMDYIAFVENNLEKLSCQIDDIVYELASSLSLIGEYERSNKLISIINVNKSEYEYEFNRLLLNNNYNLDNEKEVLRLASNLQSLSSVSISQVLYSMISSNSTKNFERYVNEYKTAISTDFNQFLFMDTDDQDWSYMVVKNRIREPLCNAYLSLELLDFVKDKNFGFYYPLFSSVLYNWALASKGALLRSLKNSHNIIRTKMYEKDYKYFKDALEYDSDDFNEDNLESRTANYISDQTKRILLDFVRRDTTQLFPEFDFRYVKEQLKNNEVAIEIIKFDAETYIAVLLNKSWEYPKYVNLNITDSKYDIYNDFWKSIENYLIPGEKVYYSPDGILNNINLELSSDSLGNVMADKYKLYRVSSTLNLCEDLYINNISNAVLYGNLKYFDSSDLLKSILGEKKRGNGLDFWEPLEETKEEIYLIKSELDKNKIVSKVYEKEFGDKSSLYKQNWKDIGILHFATHGFFNSIKENDGDEVPAMKRTGIVLSNSDYDLYYRKKSGTIFANEITNLDLNDVKLLVLSACDTAKGELTEDGVVGLQRAFKQAGVQIIIMSLEEVDSYVTISLMGEFYKLFVKGKSVREAFREAQKLTAAKFENDDWKHFIILN